MKYSVVVIDDSKFIHKIIGKLFDPKIFDVHFFTSAEEAKKTMATFPFQGREVDLVLLDIYLQDGTNKESIRFLEFLTRERKRTQVIVISGRLSSDEFAEFYYKGADSYLIKPFSEENLLPSVKKHISIARNVREYNNRPLAKINVHKRDVFIGCLSANKKIAMFLHEELMKNNIGSCCEHAELLGDEIWRPLLQDTLNRCRIFLLLLTPGSLQSDVLKQEIIQAFNRKKRDGNRFFIIPVLYTVKANELPRQIGSMHCVDISSAKNRAEHIRSLIASMKKIFKLVH